MKQVAMGRKAWLFVSNVEAGERSAMLMSLASSVNRHDLDVWTYLKDVLDRLLAGETDYEKLLPDRWKLDHPEAVRQYRVEERRDKADRKQLAAARRRILASKKKQPPHFTHRLGQRRRRPERPMVLVSAYGVLVVGLFTPW